MTSLYTIGFTGTQQGMTARQKRGVDALLGLVLSDCSPSHLRRAVHGDCIGADEEFDDIVRSYGVPTFCYPCNIEAKRAHTDAKALRDPLPPLERNRLIVNDCSVLIAAPKDMEEVLRSGTWATWRYARSVGRRRHVVWPDGRVSLGRP